MHGCYQRPVLANPITNFCLRASVRQSNYVAQCARTRMDEAETAIEGGRHKVRALGGAYVKLALPVSHWAGLTAATLASPSAPAVAKATVAGVAAAARPVWSQFARLPAGLVGAVGGLLGACGGGDANATSSRHYARSHAAICAGADFVGRQLATAVLALGNLVGAGLAATAYAGAAVTVLATFFLAVPALLATAAFVAVQALLVVEATVPVAQPTPPLGAQNDGTGERPRGLPDVASILEAWQRAAA